MSQFHALPQALTLNTALGLNAARPSILARLQVALTVAKSRRALASMDAATLADIGLTQQQARAEARRNFWDIAPQCAQ